MNARGGGPIVEGVGSLGVRFAADVLKFAVGDLEMVCLQRLSEVIQNLAKRVRRPSKVLTKWRPR